MGNTAARRRGSIDYGLGRLLDIYEPDHGSGSTGVLLWHGSGANERDVLEPLARQVAASGVAAFVPDWSCDDGGGGQHHLCASLAFTCDYLAGRGVPRVVLVGWSLGASAALDVVLRSTLLGGWRPAAFAGISGGYSHSPFHGPRAIGVPPDPSVPLPLLLVHGSSDEVVPVERARLTYEALRRAGWPVVLHEVASDHAGAIGTVYDPTAQRCVPTDEPVRRETLATVAGWISDLALTS